MNLRLNIILLHFVEMSVYVHNALVLVFHQKQQTYATLYFSKFQETRFHKYLKNEFFYCFILEELSF